MMRRLVGVTVLALAAGGCTSVKMVQRDGCWVRRTEKPFGRVIEEVGPCKAPAPQWSQDRLTRLVQECVSQASFRDQSRALEGFSRRFPYPSPQPVKDETLRTCMEEVRSGMEAERDRETMERRLADVTGERDQLREDAARDRAKLFAEVAGERDALRQGSERDRSRLQDREDKLADWLGKSHDKLADSMGRSQDKLAESMGRSQDKLAESLGLAAQKPPGNATATASSNSNSDGKATTTNDTGATVAADSGASAPPSASPVPNASVVVPATPQAAAASEPGTADAKPAATLPRRTKKVRARRTASPVRSASAQACDPTPSSPGQAAPAGARADAGAKAAPTAGTPPCAIGGGPPPAP